MCVAVFVHIFCQMPPPTKATEPLHPCVRWSLQCWWVKEINTVQLLYTQCNWWACGLGGLSPTLISQFYSDRSGSIPPINSECLYLPVKQLSIAFGVCLFISRWSNTPTHQQQPRTFIGLDNQWGFQHACFFFFYSLNTGLSMDSV